jgi:hypothetical protein
MKLTPNQQNYYDGWHILPEEFHLVFNKEYHVYAIEYIEDAFEHFYVLDETGSIYPRSYPSDFFEIVDNKLSKYWNYKKGDTYPLKIINTHKLITFKEWREEEYFEYYMLENIGDSNAIFTKYKKLIDFEFQDTSYPFAERVESNWFLCSTYNCDNSWEDNLEGEITICPKCYKLQNKPLPLG